MHTCSSGGGGGRSCCCCKGILLLHLHVTNLEEGSFSRASKLTPPQKTPACMLWALFINLIADAPTQANIPLTKEILREDGPEELVREMSEGEYHFKAVPSLAPLFCMTSRDLKPASSLFRLQAVPLALVGAFPYQCLKWLFRNLCRGPGHVAARWVRIFESKKPGKSAKYTLHCVCACVCFLQSPFHFQFLALPIAQKTSLSQQRWYQIHWKWWHCLKAGTELRKSERTTMPKSRGATLRVPQPRDNISVLVACFLSFNQLTVCAFL